MNNDDRMVGDLLSRREAVAVLAGTGAAALLAGCAPATLDRLASATPGPILVPPTATPGISNLDVPSCVVRPALTEGPYFVDERLNRSDIRTEPSTGEVRPGAPLALTFRVSQLADGACTPLAGAMVDVWHCDALGVYSDVKDPGFDTTGLMFLRGYQQTDSEGSADFTTIYPGWYPGRAVHIHFKIRNDLSPDSRQEFISQLFFEEAMTDIVHAQQPYAAKGVRTLRNDGDRIFQQGGDQLLLAVEPDQGGYRATFDIGLAR
ncbi:MAG TPA: intradiol ring-cleavage dioxygenase [Anaerolineales bacterium]|jgi:protocatechuate 3,4-dioxygenase beta subunit